MLLDLQTYFVITEFVPHCVQCLWPTVSTTHIRCKNQEQASNETLDSALLVGKYAVRCMYINSMPGSKKV